MGSKAPARDPMFVLAMPRCRTAWLSVCLSALGVDCSHEGMREHSSFAEYAAELEARLAEGPAGDADPGLVYWLPEILERWPRARFAVIAREDEEALEATVRAAPLAEGILRRGWSGYLQAFKGAGDVLRERARARRSSVHFLMASQLADDATVARLLEWLTGRRPSPMWVRRHQRLKVTATIAVPASAEEADSSRFPESATAKAHESGRMPLLLSSIDTTGLTAELVRNADFPLVANWWQAHTGEALAQAALPPLGVLVSDAAGPCAAVWCYECFGVPVAELVFPVTRPGMSLRAASAALAYGLAACVAAAGKAHEPEAAFRFFKVFAPRPTVRFLKRLGFRECLTERTAMILDLTWLPSQSPEQ